MTNSTASWAPARTLWLAPAKTTQVREDLLVVVDENNFSSHGSGTVAQLAKAFMNLETWVQFQPESFPIYHSYSFPVLYIYSGVK